MHTFLFYCDNFFETSIAVRYCVQNKRQSLHSLKCLMDCFTDDNFSLLHKIPAAINVFKITAFERIKEKIHNFKIHG